MEEKLRLFNALGAGLNRVVDRARREEGLNERKSEEGGPGG